MNNGPQFSPAELRYMAAVEVQLTSCPLIGDPMPLEQAFRIVDTQAERQRQLSGDAFIETLSENPL